MNDCRREIEELERQRLQVRRKIDGFDEEIAHMDRMNTKIDYIKWEREKAERELKKLEKDIKKKKSRCLFEALLSLDYRVPAEVFLGFSRSEKIGAFLLHGSTDIRHEYSGYSIRMLLNRLMRHVPASSGKIMIRRDFRDVSQRHEPQALWRALAASIDLEYGATNQDIINGVCEVLETEHVILIFKGIDVLPEGQLDTLIVNFWSELAHGVQRTHAGPGLLLLFLFDQSGAAKNWCRQYFEQREEFWYTNGNWQPTLPIRLPVASRFSSGDLHTWIEVNTRDLPHVLHDDLMRGPLPERVQRVLDQSNNGDPDLVLSHICNMCGHFIEGMEECLVF